MPSAMPLDKPALSSTQRGHAIGYPMYDLSAIVYRLGTASCAEAVEQRKREYINKLFYWNEHTGDHEGEWADFMLK